MPSLQLLLSFFVILRQSTQKLNCIVGIQVQNQYTSQLFDLDGIVCMVLWALLSIIVVVEKLN